MSGATSATRFPMVAMREALSVSFSPLPRLFWRKRIAKVRAPLPRSEQSSGWSAVAMAPTEGTGSSARARPRRRRGGCMTRHKTPPGGRARRGPPPRGC
eukprot:574743-Prymnesium_polylepis.1